MKKIFSILLPAALAVGACTTLPNPSENPDNVSTTNKPVSTAPANPVTPETPSQPAQSESKEFTRAATIYKKHAEADPLLSKKKLNEKTVTKTIDKALLTQKSSIVFAFSTLNLVLKKLTELEVASFTQKTAIKVDQGIKALTNLESLVLMIGSKAPIEIDAQLYSLSKLKVLKILPNGVGNNSPILYDLPAGIEALQNLQVISLSSLKSIPKGLEKITTLKEIKFFKCGIEESEVKWLKSQLPEAEIKVTYIGSTKELVY